jgi:hypothetical protein
MTKFTILLSLLMLNKCLFAQEHSLQLSHDCEEEIASPFSTVYAIDNRLGSELIGYINTGIMNRVKTVTFTGNLADSMATYFSNGKPDGKSMVLILNEFFMHESDSGPGRLKISLRLFSETSPGRFGEFLTVDSLYRPRGIDVTKRLLRTVSQQLCVIAKEAAQVNITQKTSEVDYSMEDLFHLDSLEKISIPMYTASRPNPGIYKDYEHFKMNTPNINTEIFIDTSKAKRVKIYRIYKVKNRKIPLEFEGVYAVSDGNKIFKVSAQGDYFEIKKQNFDFFYERVGSFAAQPANAIPLYIYPGGLIGGVVAGAVIGGINAATAQNTIQRYRFRINHRRGNSIPVVVVKN